jgi:hypothetical protein
MLNTVRTVRQPNKERVMNELDSDGCAGAAFHKPSEQAQQSSLASDQTELNPAFTILGRGAGQESDIDTLHFESRCCTVDGMTESLWRSGPVGSAVLRLLNQAVEYL